MGRRNEITTATAARTVSRADIIAAVVREFWPDWSGTIEINVQMGGVSNLVEKRSNKPQALSFAEAMRLERRTNKVA